MWSKSDVSSRIVALVAVFAALNVISDSIVVLPDPNSVWQSGNFLFEPITGIILGPLLGFVASFTGVMVGHYILFINIYEFVFTLGAPIGAAISALLFKGRWKPVLLFYCMLFASYFASPVAWQLPMWGMWDTYLAFALLIFSILLIKRGWWRLNDKKLFFVLAITAFVGLEADVLFRIFLFVPMQTYSIFYGFNVEFLQSIWAVASIVTPLKVALSTLATMIIGPPLLSLLERIKFHNGN